jgi:hypothetical protein
MGVVFRDLGTLFDAELLKLVYDDKMGVLNNISPIQKSMGAYNYFASETPTTVFIWAYT